MSESIEQDRIEENLRATRSRMDQRLNELQGRLTPGQLVEDVIDYMKNNGGGVFAQNLLDSAQRNPMPAVVAGIGLVWLMASNFRPAPAPAPMRTVAPPAGAYTGMSGDYTGSGFAGDSYVGGAYPGGGGWQAGENWQADAMRGRLHAAEAGVIRGPDDTDAGYAERLDDARGAVLGVARQTQDTAASYAARVQAAISAGMQSATQSAHDLRDKASGAAGQLRDTVTQTGGQLRDKAGQLTGQISGQLAQGAQAAKQSGSDWAQTVVANPVALGALGVAAGAILGLLLPSTDKEEAALGDVAGQARQTVRDAAQGLVDHGADVAKQVIGTARDSAAAHGFTTDKSVEDLAAGVKSGDIVNDAKQVVQEVLTAGGQALRGGAGQGAPQGDETPAAPPT